MLISERHAALYREYYARKIYEMQENVRTSAIAELSDKVGANSLLDYGCGMGSPLGYGMGMDIQWYDPGIQQYSNLPRPADIVACLDVLEHVEPECVDAVIEHILSLAKKAVYLTISCQPSTKVLFNGAPWHSFVKEHDWWKTRLPQFECRSIDNKTYIGVYLCR